MEEVERDRPIDGSLPELKGQQYSWPAIRFDVSPFRVHHFFKEFRESKNRNNFLKSVKWSPDGSCFLTSSEDNTLRVFYLPVSENNSTSIGSSLEQDSYSASLIVNEGESIYDFCWYPFMSASDPVSSVFATTTRDHPIHLWDATSGELRCTYRAYDAMDEITAAFSIGFNPAGTKIFAGYNKSVRVFDLHRPGREFEQFTTLQGNKEGQGGFLLRPVIKDTLMGYFFGHIKCYLLSVFSTSAALYSTGIISAIAFPPTNSGMVAMGSYDHTTAIYREENMEPLYVLHGQEGGITHVQYSKDGNYLYTGGRKDPYILCWDVRKAVEVVYKLYRATENTNQRVLFDIEPCGQHLGTGGQDGLVHIYDLEKGHWVSGFQAAADTVNGFSFHPYLPMAVSSSGHRRFQMFDEEDDLELKGDENCASVWSFYNDC